MIFKRIFLLFIMLLILTMYSMKIYAIDSIIHNADDFLEEGKSTILDYTSMENVSDQIFNIFLAVGTAVVVVVGTILGIQFILGSAEEKAKIKESLIPYTVGTIIIFGAIIIWALVINVLQSVF